MDVRCRAPAFLRILLVGLVSSPPGGAKVLFFVGFVAETLGALQAFPLTLCVFRCVSRRRNHRVADKDAERGFSAKQVPQR